MTKTVLLEGVREELDSARIIKQLALASKTLHPKPSPVSLPDSTVYPWALRGLTSFLYVLLRYVDPLIWVQLSQDLEPARPPRTKRCNSVLCRVCRTQNLCSDVLRCPYLKVSLNLTSWLSFNYASTASPHLLIPFRASLQNEYPEASVGAPEEYPLNRGIH